MKIINLFIQYFSFFPSQGVLWIFCIIIIVLIYMVLKLKISIKYKIHNFFINFLLILLYLGYYILILLVLRILFWGKTIDIKPYIEKILFFWQFSHVLFILFLLTMALLYLILFKLRFFLIKEIRKRHLYQIYNSKIYKFLILKFSSTMSYQNYLDKISNYLSKIINKRPEYLRFNSLFNLIIRYMPLAILFNLIIYDCLVNNFLISKIFYFLPFYIIYIVWYNITEFLYYTNHELNEIIHERFYLEDKMLYINTTSEEDKLFEKYLGANLMPSWYFVRYDENLYNIQCNTFKNWLVEFIQQRKFLYKGIENNLYIYQNLNYKKTSLQSEILSNEEDEEGEEGLNDLFRQMRIRMNTGAKVLFTKEELDEIKNNKND